MTFRQIYTIMAAENTQPYDLFSQFALYPARGWIAPPLPVRKPAVRPDLSSDLVAVYAEFTALARSHQEGKRPPHDGIICYH